MTLILLVRVNVGQQKNSNNGQSVSHARQQTRCGTGTVASGQDLGEGRRKRNEPVRRARGAWEREADSLDGRGETVVVI